MVSTKKFVLVGNNLFVDFVNTKILRDGKPFDPLESFGDFLGWSEAVGLIDKSRAEDFLAEKNSEKKFEEILSFRDVLRTIARQITAGKKPEKEQIEALNEKLGLQKRSPKIEMSGGGFVKSFRAELDSPGKLLAQIAESVADFLAENRPDLLKVCESNDCILYFYDTTRNHSRRWCSMDGCGNRAKANAFYRRKKGSG